jgi:hypothetical protein
MRFTVEVGNARPLTRNTQIVDTLVPSSMDSVVRFAPPEQRFVPFKSQRSSHTEILRLPRAAFTRRGPFQVWGPA